MRQTSRAVALLLALESANAGQTFNIPDSLLEAYSTNVFNPLKSAQGAPTNTLQLNSRTAGYKNAPEYNIPVGAGWKNLKATTGVMVANTTDDNSKIVSGSGCMNCLNKSGVWCSRTFSYLSTKSTSAYFQNDQEAAGGSMTQKPNLAGLVFGSAKDGGSCCAKVEDFNKFIGTVKTKYSSTYGRHVAALNGPSIAAGGLPMTNIACPALMSTNTNDGTPLFGETEIDNVTTEYSGWWCSNGLYKTVQSAGNVTLNAQQVIPQGVNKRLELAQVGCPQQDKMCGYTTDIAKSLDKDAIWTIVMPDIGFGVDFKCTWVAYSIVAGPAFTLQNTLLSGLKGLSTLNWQIHAMEYTSGPTTTAVTFNEATGSLIAGKVTNGFNTVEEALAAPKNLTPLFTMPAKQFATLRTWYGEGKLAIDTFSGASEAWLTPGYANYGNTTDQSSQLAATKSQLYGNVSNIPYSEYGDIVGAKTLGTGQNYGLANTVKFDLRQVRYFPAKVAQTNWATGDTALKTYNTALSGYKTAKTTWDNYVAILEKNASQDAFAALFSPPKAPTVPPLPNKPWLPAAYSGYVRATQKELYGFQQNASTVTSVASPTASQFWTSIDAAQTVGGWGSFTASIYRFRNGWGKSFGTIGYSGDAKHTEIPDVWNYQWQCAANSDAALASTDGSQCAPKYTATAGQVATVQGVTTANAVRMITAVSLWSTANEATALSDIEWAQSNFQLTFTAKAWNSQIVALIPIAKPEQATDAKSLTGLAGAQALVASSAAALAVAAALY